MRLQSTADLPCHEAYERHDRTFVAWCTHRNGEPSVGTYQHKDHPDLRQNHQPEDKPRHGNLVAQTGGHGKGYLRRNRIERPCIYQYGYIDTLIYIIEKVNTDERKKEHYHDGRAGQYLPADRYRHYRHDRVGNLRTVRGNRPDGSGRDKGTLQKRSFEHT